MHRVEKAEAIKGLQEQFAAMSSAVFLDFTGMTVEEVSRLRDHFRARGVEYRVIKNKLVQKALAPHSFAKELGHALRGMTGVAWSFGEPSAAARVVREFCKDNDKLKIKAGLLEGQLLAARAVEQELANLPNKDEIRARLLATFMAPAQRLVMLLNAPAREFVGVLAAKQRKDGGEVE